MGVHITHGVEPWRIFAQYMGRVDGPTHGRDGNVHIGDANLVALYIPGRHAHGFEGLRHPAADFVFGQTAKMTSMAAVSPAFRRTYRPAAV